MSPFKQRVLMIIASIPAGKVVSYGQVALYAGVPRAARQVGWILNSLEEESVPWWRVVNNKGYLSIRGNQAADKLLQKKLLEAEGIPVSQDFLLPMEEFRYCPGEKELKQFQLEDEYISMVVEKYGV